MMLIDRAQPRKEGRLDVDVDDEDQLTLPRFCIPSSSSSSSSSHPSMMQFRGIYLALLAVRLYFALQPSYIHPDENFQGPEITAGLFFKWPVHLAWEFSRAHPIRSILPIWMLYSFPITVANWTWKIFFAGNPPPWLVFALFRFTMFLISFVLEDLAIMKLLPSQTTRKQTLLLVASSYATWVFQTHTFSNSIETVGVLWALVLAKHIQQNQYNSEISCAIFAVIAVFGAFTRITFPFWLIVPSLQLLPHFWRNPWSLVSAAVSALLVIVVNILADTKYYADIADTSENPFGLTSFVLCPLNNIKYNSHTSNFRAHGIHPRWLHFVVNFFILLGPAYLIILYSVVAKHVSRLRLPRLFSFRNVRGSTAFIGTLLLSVVPHQEPRFLLPAVPLLLSCLHNKHLTFRVFTIPWIAFNVIMGIGLGMYHQAGVFPFQASVPRLFYDISVPPASDATLGSARVFWWMTYTPPYWLLGDVHMPYRPLPYDNFKVIRTVASADPNALKMLDEQVPKNATLLPPLSPSSSGVDGTSSSNARGQQQHSANGPGPGRGVNGIRISYRDPIIVVTPRTNPLIAPYIAPSSLSSTQSSSLIRAYAPANKPRPQKEVDSDIEFHLLKSTSYHITGIDKDAEGSTWDKICRAISHKGLDAWLITRSRKEQRP